MERWDWPLRREDRKPRLPQGGCLPGRHFKRRRQSAAGDTVRGRAGLGAKDHEAILLDPQKVFGLEVAEISLELHTVELGHLIDGTETKTAKSESEINC